MATVTVYNIDGTKKDSLKLSDDIFALPSNDVLLHQVVTAYVANRRQSTSHTKDRSERRGSGRKPWKQKGTGNARTGSVRNPIWRKGGVIFGPLSQRNFAKKTTLKMRRKAFALGLSEKLRSNNIFVIDNFSFSENKTKNFVSMLKALNISGRSCTVALSESEKDISLLGRNIPKVMSRSVSTLNTYDLVNTSVLLISEKSIKDIQERLSTFSANKSNSDKESKI